VQLVAIMGLWAGWAVVVALALVPTTVSLTGLRLIAPVAPVTVLWAVARGLPAVTASVAIAAAVVAATLAFSAELGQPFVQGSAYGDERRFPLRVPGPLALGPLEVGWSVVTAAVLAGPLLLAARQWIVGGLVSACAGPLAYGFALRCHRLTRRFAVILPAGVVLHDQMVLADTALFRRPTVTALALAPADTEAADLTGKALGLAVELRLTDMVTVVLTGTRQEQQGRAIHLRSAIFAPSRPGRVLEEAQRRGYAVG
jgi:hypothetical protein